MLRSPVREPFGDEPRRIAQTWHYLYGPRTRVAQGALCGGRRPQTRGRERRSGRRSAGRRSPISAHAYCTHSNVWRTCAMRLRILRVWTMGATIACSDTECCATRARSRGAASVREMVSRPHLDAERDVEQPHVAPVRGKTMHLEESRPSGRLAARHGLGCNRGQRPGLRAGAALHPPGGGLGEGGSCPCGQGARLGAPIAVPRAAAR